MRPGARSPEELETLFEDGAVLVRGATPTEARGAQEIARVATAMWERDVTYVADPRRVLQARDTALVVAQHGINVVRRGDNGTWRYAISLLDFDDND
ncbi:hypothetical protein BH20ACT17_BH20ACT17_07210 [soil metagenome]